jgi:hypothetical protein
MARNLRRLQISNASKHYLVYLGVLLGPIVTVEPAA